MRLHPFVECPTEEAAKKIADYFKVSYVFTGYEPKPWLVIGTSEKLQEFEAWMVELYTTSAK